MKLNFMQLIPPAYLEQLALSPELVDLLDERHVLHHNPRVLRLVHLAVLGQLLLQALHLRGGAETLSAY